jgi:hypothetical protein
MNAKGNASPGSAWQAGLFNLNAGAIRRAVRPSVRSAGLGSHPPRAYTLRPKIFAPFDFYRERLTIRLIQKICANAKTILYT